MTWLYLFVAGLLESGWAIGLKYTNGFTRPIPSLLTGLAIAASMFFLSLAVRTLPVGTAYSIWVGIGSVGAVILGIVLLGEPASATRLFFTALLVVAVVGLKVTSGH